MTAQHCAGQTVAAQRFVCSGYGAETGTPLADGWTVGPPVTCPGCRESTPERTARKRT